jgi:hypothetical protein
LVYNVKPWFLTYHGSLVTGALWMLAVLFLSSLKVAIFDKKPKVITDMAQDSAEEAEIVSIPHHTRKHHFYSAFFMTYAWVFIVTFIYSYSEQMLTAIMRGFGFATVASLVLGLLAFLFGKRVVTAIKAFIEWAGLS